MRPITLRHAGECRKCAAALPAGAAAIYERRVGIFCPPCAPTDPEEIRAYRQEGADRRADRIDGWAASREAKAAALMQRNERYRGDVAFNTQPGYIPERARAIRRTERACEHSIKAQEHAARANSIRSGVRVAGDAEERHEAARERVRGWIKPGMRVECGVYEPAEVVKVNRKSVTVRGRFGEFRVDLSLVGQVRNQEEGGEK